ncbi:type 2 isopentenyl-diphosphate Delta-isomerase [Ancylomarina longa]|uniref:Type 2 isopentenyl-diphosphate Delta-isomerase n=1 Tax=Ancylomarina longa TaxID=2487017 RepID=A0A434AU86_9BACT|nr:type 2 isopentenyl-diphosphate Delta-isomerase [Ancylomarina longa]RUT78005.1 type 2 isopentenyl-diphosphate Delta-isomerase [Ancylomarina longa]
MANRKKDHIDLAFRSQIEKALLDERFYYEPLLSPHPKPEETSFSFLGKCLRTPIWVSSMTGGTRLAEKINKNLALACAEFGMGMGLGSCRSLLQNDNHFSDFDVRSIIGNELPLYANLGICQLEESIANGELNRIGDLIGRLDADGLIIHINPMQEWLQPEGDRMQKPPIESIEFLLKHINFPVIVKEVGQGMGPESLQTLMRMPLQAIEFAAFGGTNFAKVEMMRNPNSNIQLLDPLTRVGHTADQMIKWLNDIVINDDKIQCKEVIISGGIRNFLDGYYFMEKCKLPSIYGQASELLKYAQVSYDKLRSYLLSQKQGLQISQSYLKLRK